MNIEKSRDFPLVSDFLQQHFSAPTHWPGWNELVSRTFGTDFYYLIASDRGAIAGICPVHQTRYKKGLKEQASGRTHFIPFGGWIFSRPTSVNADFFPSQQNTFSQVFTLPLLQEFNCRYDIPTTQNKATLIVNLEATEEELWSNLRSNGRRQIRKAAKRNVNVRQASTAADMEEAYRLYVAASRRNGLKVLSRAFFEDLQNQCPNISLDILIAHKEGQQLANLVMISDKDYALYWLGNNEVEVSNEGQGDLLQWEAIKLAKKKGCAYYDLCYVEPERLPNIYQFKKKFSEEEYPVLHFTLKTILFKVLNKIV